MPIPTLAEKLEWLKPAPATEFELACMKTIRPGDYEIGVQITNDILDEAMEIFVRSSRSYFGVSGDSMVAIFTAGGDLINGMRDLPARDHPAGHHQVHSEVLQREPGNPRRRYFLHQ